MMLTHPDLKIEILYSEEHINVLVIENEDFFFQTVQDFWNQINKIGGHYVLSEEYEQLDFSKNVELHTQFVPFDMNKKDLITKLYAKLNSTANNEELYMKTMELSQKINSYVNELTRTIDNDLDYSATFDLATLFKGINLRFNDEYNSLSEKIIEYMANTRQFESDKLHIFVNYKSYVSKDELKALYETIINHKYKVLFVESHDGNKLQYEKKYIIDNKMCEIY